MPVIAGEKPANERFPGADNTYSIEAMMQDGKALQAGTSHYLGTHFAEAQNIRFQNAQGELDLLPYDKLGRLDAAHRRRDHDSWRRRRSAPAADDRAASQIVIVPMLREKPEDSALIEYCVSLEKELKAAGIRTLVDLKPIKSAEKRWNWVRRGAPVIVEIGGRDVSGGNVTFMRRDRLRDGDKVISNTLPRAAFVAEAAALLKEIQGVLYTEAKTRLDGNIISKFRAFEELVDYFGEAGIRRRRGRFQRLGACTLVTARGREP